MAPEAERPFVSVVVPVRNGAATIGDCIGSLLALDFPPERREILVVDNASRDETAGIVASFSVRCVEEHRVGRAYARNRGIEESAGELIAFLDADCVASPRWLAELVSSFEVEEVDGVAGEILPYRPSTGAERYMARKLERWQLPAFTHERPFAVTANVAYRRSVFRRIGLFDPFFVTSEDVDLSYRFFAAGLELRYCDAAVVYHRHRATGRGLFRQQYGLGYGRALTRSLYGLPVWSWEARRYAWLAAAIGRLAVAPLRHVAGRAHDGDLSFAYYDVLLLGANRLGALHWYATSARKRGWAGPPGLPAAQGSG